MAFLRTGVILLLALVVAALPASVHADGIQILTHGHDNTNSGQGATNQTPTKPKDLTAAPVLKGKHVKPAIPANVNKVGTMVPVVAVNLSVDLTTHETNGVWRWNAMLQNMSTQPLPVNRLQLKVVQLTPLAPQTAPAGSAYTLPPLSPQQKRGFSSVWNRHQTARQLRLEVWDQRAHTKVYEKVLALANPADQMAAPLSPGMQKVIATPGAREPSRIALPAVVTLVAAHGGWSSPTQVFIPSRPVITPTPMSTSSPPVTTVSTPFPKTSPSPCPVTSPGRCWRSASSMNPMTVTARAWIALR